MNYNVVPTGKRDVLLTGNYQAGTWVVDFTDPRGASTVAYEEAVATHSLYVAPLVM